jgi:hypothetical protein
MSAHTMNCLLLVVVTHADRRYAPLIALPLAERSTKDRSLLSANFYPQ